MRIAVDAMGSDNHPTPDVNGTVQAAQELMERGLQMELLLVGDEARITPLLSQQDAEAAAISVHHAPQTITMTDKPSVVVKSKRESSMHIGMKLLAEGTADAFVTMGNTGAALSIATLYAPRRIRGVKRPALTAIFPVRGRRTVFLDVGANADTKVEWMTQFGLMGSMYTQYVLGYNEPRVGLLSNGEEDGKGMALIRETAAILQETPLVNFVGNIEPEDIFVGKVDVVLADGFTGNLLVKTFESSSRYLNDLIREELRSNPVAALGGLMIRPAMRRVRSRMDTAEVGGAPLLGVDGIVIIGHGSSTAFGVKNAIHQAVHAVKARIVEHIRESIAHFD